MHRVPLLARDLGERLDRLGDAGVVEVDVEAAELVGGRPAPRRPRAASRPPPPPSRRAARRTLAAPPRGRGRRRPPRAPSSANRRAVARPIPDPAPVTTATFPSKRPMPGSVARMARRVIHCVDAHAEGEPSRIIVGGVLDVPGDDDAREGPLARARGRLAAAAVPVRAARLGAAVRRPRAALRRCPRPTPASSSWSPRPTRGCRGRTRSTPRRCCSRRGWCRLVEPETRMVAGGARGAGARAARCSGGRVDDITFENVPSFCTALDAVVEVPDVGSLRWISPTAARGARSWTRPRWGSRSCPTRRGRWASWASGSARTRRAALDRAPARARPQLPLVRRLRRPAAGRRRRAARDDRLPRPARPLAHRAPRPPPAIAVLDARGTLGDAYVAESVIDTRFSGRVVGRTKVGEHRRGRARDHRPRLDHGLPPARASTRPTRSRDGFKLPDTWGSGSIEGTLNP